MDANNSVSTSFADVHVKKEVEEGGTNNNLRENCIPSTMTKNNTHVHCESKSQNTITCTKTKTLENSKNTKKSETGKKPTKRKDFEEKLQLIRKSLKLIPADGSETLPFLPIQSHTVDSSHISSAEAQILRKIIPIVTPVIEETNLKIRTSEIKKEASNDETHIVDTSHISCADAQMLRQNISLEPTVEEINLRNGIRPIINETSIHESSKVAEKDNMDNDDIDILPVPVVKKNILVITLSDDEEELSQSHSKSTQIKHSKNPRKNDVIRDQSKRKLARDKAISHDASKTREKKKSLTSKVSQSDKTTKRRPDCEEAISKRIKREADEASQKHSFLLNKSQTTEEQNVPVAPMTDKKDLEHTINRIIKDISDDDESSKEAEDHTTHTDTIAILPVIKVEKDASMPTVSCENEGAKCGGVTMESNNYTSITPSYISTSICSTELGKLGDVSTDILRYFNVVSNLDRYECQIALEYLSTCKTKSNLDDFFPFIKKEKKTAHKIMEGDILFKSVIAEIDYGSESAPILQNVNNTSSEQVFEKTAQLPPESSSVSAQSTSLPVASNIENNLSINLQPTTDSSVLNSNVLHTMSYGQIEAMLNKVKFTDIDPKLGNGENKVASANPHKIPLYTSV